MISNDQIQRNLYLLVFKKSKKSYHCLLTAQPLQLWMLLRISEQKFMLCWANQVRSYSSNAQEPLFFAECCKLISLWSPFFIYDEQKSLYTDKCIFYCYPNTQATPLSSGFGARHQYFLSSPGNSRVQPGLKAVSFRWLGLNTRILNHLRT